jgi:hypothetical protein
VVADLYALVRFRRVDCENERADVVIAELIPVRPVLVVKYMNGAGYGKSADFDGTGERDIDECTLK